MTGNTNLTIPRGSTRGVLELVNVPFGVEKTINTLVELCKGSPNIKTPMLQIVNEIANDYPEFLSAQFVLGCLVVSRTHSLESAGEFFYKAWLIGHRALLGQPVNQLAYAGSMTNATFLSAGAMLAEYFVRHGNLADALEIADRMVSLDVDNGSAAMFVQAHVHQLMGMKSAINTLEAVARDHEPMAFYALGLEQLRVKKDLEARSSFVIGMAAAPAVAAILLNRQELNMSQTRIQQHHAARYVESFCLSEWSAEEINALGNVLANDSSIRTILKAMTPWK